MAEISANDISPFGFFVYFGHTEPLTHRLMFVFENTRDGVVLEIGLFIYTRLHNQPTYNWFIPFAYTRLQSHKNEPDYPKINKIPDLDANWSIGI